MSTVTAGRAPRPPAVCRYVSKPPFAKGSRGPCLPTMLLRGLPARRACSSAVWNDTFVATLQKTSGKGAAAEAAVNTAQDILSAALDSHGVQASAPVKANGAPKAVIGAKKTPTEEVFEEINKIKDRLSLLPIKSSGALYGPGEGIMKVYEQLKEAETLKREADLTKPAELRRVPLAAGGMTLPRHLFADDEVQRRNLQHAACTA